MGEAEFTPGPWTVRAPDSPLHVLISANGDDVDGKRNGGVYVARVTGPDALANAPLIAAAPELLKALEAALPIIASDYEFGAPQFHPISPGRVLEMTRAALALVRNTPVSDQGGGK